MKIFNSSLLHDFSERQIEAEYRAKKVKKYQKFNVWFTSVNVVLNFFLFLNIAIRFYFTSKKKEMTKTYYVINYIVLVFSCLFQLSVLLAMTLYSFSFVLNRIITWFNLISIYFIFDDMQFLVFVVFKQNLSLTATFIILEFILRFAYIYLKFLNFLEILISHVLVVILKLVHYLVTDENVIYLICYDISILVIIIFSYNFLKEDRIKFYYEHKIKSNFEWTLSMMNESSTGVMRIINGKISYINQQMKNFINHIYSAEYKNLAKNSDDSLKEILLNEVAEFLSKNNNMAQANYFILPSINSSISGTSEAFKKPKFDFFKLPKTDTFTNLGQKTFSQGKKELTLELLYRFFEDQGKEVLEFIFKDFSICKKTTELKYKSLFFSKLAHEFKNPLLTLTELSDMITDNKNQVEKNLNLIKGLCQYMLVLSKDLECFSQIQNNIQPPIFLSRVNLKETVNFVKNIVIGLLAKNNKEKSIKFQCFIEKDTPNFIVTDEIKLKQILINLLSNSVKFTDKGFIELKVFTNGNNVAFSVNDSGRGINEELQRTIYLPFEMEMDGNTLGSGLGLVIVRELTNLIGTTIEFTSKVGEGSSFGFTIPKRLITEGVEGVSSSSEDNEESELEKTIRLNNLQLSCVGSREDPGSLMRTAKKISSKKIRTINIIIADDEPIVKASTKRIFEKYGKANKIKFNIFEADDGFEVVTIVTKQNQKGEGIDLIICDENMLYCNGNQCKKILEGLEKENKIPKIPFFFVSANISPYYVNNEDNKNEPEHILTKPLCYSSVSFILQSLKN